MKTKVTETISDILAEGADVHRCAAARALGCISGPRSVALLTRALLDEDPDVRIDAATALQRLQDPASADALMENLIGDPEGDVKMAAVKALVAMRHAPVVPILRKLVESRSDDIAWDEEEFYSEGWDSWVDLQIEALTGLAEFGDEGAVDAIMAAMGDEMGQDITEPGVAALARLGHPGAQALAQMLEGAVPRLRRQIACAVAAGASPDLALFQEKLLADPSPDVRLITMAALDSEDPAFARLLEDENEDIRAAAVAIAGAGHSDVIKKMIADDAANVRTEVFKVIAANPELFRSDEVIKAVKAGITGDPEAAKQAALALIALKGSKVAKGLAHVLTSETVPLEFRLGAVEVLKTAGAVSVPSLLGAAVVPERQVRLAALTAVVDFAANDPIWPNAAGVGLLTALRGELVPTPEEEESGEDEEAGQGATGPAEEVPEMALSQEEMQEIDDSLPLIARPLEEAAPSSTLHAIAAVNPDAVGDPEPAAIELSEAEQDLLEVSKRRRMPKKMVSLHTTVAPYLDVKRFAARLLGGVVNREVSESLVAALSEDDPELRDAVLTSLIGHGEKTGALPDFAAAPLAELIAGTAGETRVLAVRAYGWLGVADVDEKLHALLDDPDDFVRLEAVRALARRGIADEAVLARLDDSYIGVAVAAAEALARLRGHESVDALVDFAMQDDGAQRREIGRLLGKYAPEAGTRRLLEVLEDDRYQQRWLVAIDALSEVFSQPGAANELKVA